MPYFGLTSKRHLATCHPDLQRIFNEVIKHFDCKIICGHRSKEAQDAAYNGTPRRTQVQWPDSRHNSNPSEGIDAIPYPVDWDDRERFTLLAGHVLMCAKAMEIKLRWGGDWDRDTEVKDNSFDDLPHYELDV